MPTIWLNSARPGGSAFSKIVKARDDHRRRPDLSSANPMSQNWYAQRAATPATCRGPDAKPWNGRRRTCGRALDVSGGLRLAERDVDGGKNAARERQQVR